MSKQNLSRIPFPSRRRERKTQGFLSGIKFFEAKILSYYQFIRQRNHFIRMPSRVSSRLLCAMPLGLGAKGTSTVAHEGEGSTQAARANASSPRIRRLSFVGLCKVLLTNEWMNIGNMVRSSPSLSCPALPRAFPLISSAVISRTLTRPIRSYPAISA